MDIIKIIIKLIIFIFISMFISTTNAAINMTVSPIKYEINSQTGATITKEASLTNHTNETIHIITGKSDFVSNGENGMPKFIRKSEVVFEQELSDWITIDTASFDIAPNETKIINFTINVPDNATPGGHYGAVFFKNNNSENSSGTNVGINVDYGVLILLNIDGEIKSEIKIGTPIIQIGHSGKVRHMDVCNETGGDKSGDYYDNKCTPDNNTDGNQNSNSGELNNNQNSNNDELNNNQNSNNDELNNNQDSNNDELNNDQNSNNDEINNNQDSNNDEINNNQNSNNIDKNNLGINKDETIKKDDCIADLTNSDFDSKCIDNIDEIVKEITGNIDNEEIKTDNNDNNLNNIGINNNNLNNDNNLDNNNNNKNKDNNDNFKIKIGVPIDNLGNTHVKPSGKIILIDENGNKLKGIGKKVITNDKGAIIGEKIVDYLPFNDIGGNILPGTKRLYESDWKGFPYKSYDDEGNIIINYWTPTEYYTNNNLKKKTFMMPWERVCSKINHKKITAKFNINYPDENGENIEYNSAKEFYVDYKEQYIGINPYFFILLGLLGILLLLLFLIFKKKKVRCINKECRRKIDKDIKICPYCGTNQIKNDNPKKDPKVIIAAKKQKLKTKKLELKENIKNILIENKLKYAEDITKLNSNEILQIKGIGEKAVQEIKKALKKEKMKLKK